MSFQGAVRRRLAIGGMAALGVIALSPIFENQVYAQDSDSSRPAPSETVKQAEPSEPIPHPTLRESSSEPRSGETKTARTGINSDKKSVPDSKPKAAAKKPVDRKAPRNAKPEKLAKRGNYSSRGY